MRFHVTIGGERREVELERARDGWNCRVNGRPRQMDVVETAPGVFSLLLDGASFEVHVERVDGGLRVHSCGADVVVAVEDPRRWRGRTGTAAGPHGPQSVVAPMPGKVVRLLVEERQEVEEGQGLAVVEAMKMQNEIPSPKKGVVEKILVRAGSTVEHGQTLAVVA